MARLAQWATGEPVRLYVYSVVGAVLAVLIVYGVIDSSAVPVILAAASAVLAVPAVELARSKVSPVGDTTQEG